MSEFKNQVGVSATFICNFNISVVDHLSRKLVQVHVRKVLEYPGLAKSLE
jgi:hypothetical protein